MTARLTGLIFAVTFILCGFALLYAQGRILSQAFINTAIEKPLSDGCYKLSAPGLIFALAIHPNYYSKGTMVSDFIIVTFNGVFYAAPVIFLCFMFLRWRGRGNL